jgi:hypothetical protein
MSRLCRLEALAGREQLCRGWACPFWEPGGAVLPGRCMFERLDFTGRPALVAELLRLREQLDEAAPGDEESRTLHLYHQLLNESEEE